ncbi:MAG: pantoate--beta-alanine ligase [Solirubrobacterales bacterium]
MLTLTTVDELRAELDAARLGGRSIGLVPTMGALHEGHLSLIDRSVAENGVTVVTVFVNPTQFRPGEDLDAYPRQLADDVALAAERGADIVFAPTADEVYMDGHATTVSVVGITETLCGAPDRRGREHFDGVTTVVAKLFNMAQADRAYFGQKDAQQVAVIRRMARDLNFRTAVIACPTVREADGLAMSSRNAYLSDKERVRALAISRALGAVSESFSAGQRDVAELAAIARAELFDVDAVEYLEIVDFETLEPVSEVTNATLVAIAARVGSTRLIDNTLLDPSPDNSSGFHPNATPRETSSAIHQSRTL